MKRNALYKRTSIVKRISITNILIFLLVSALSIIGTLKLNIQYHDSRVKSALITAPSSL